MTLLSRENPEKHPHFPLSVCTAMSQGYIGYDITNKLREELLDRGLKGDVSCVLTQVEVDPQDPAFRHPTKPIGPFLTKEEADRKAMEKRHVFIEDSGRGYRRVVASPEPKSIIEIDTIRSLADAGYVVICTGGGGIPVFKAENHHLKGAPAVIDKDRASELLAEELDADFLIILTAVENAAINYGKPDEQKLGDIITIDGDLTLKDAAGPNDYPFASADKVLLPEAGLENSEQANGGYFNKNGWKFIKWNICKLCIL
jgi:carbamate kinase